MIDQFHPCNPTLKLHPQVPENGDWVKFKFSPDKSKPQPFIDGPRGFLFFNGNIPSEAHVCPQGYFVGIYTPSGRDALGEFVAAHIAVVDTDGDNLVAKGQNVRLALTQVTDLHLLESREHRPAARLARELSALHESDHALHQTRAWFRRRLALREKAKIEGAEDESKFVADEQAKLYAV